MNAAECARLVSVVRALYPAQRFDADPQTVVQAWGHVVADVQYDEAHAAVVRLARRAVAWVSPGDVRREVAAGRFVLAPDVDALLYDIRWVASHDGAGRSALHPAAQTAYDVVGGSLAIRRMDTIGLLQLRKVIAEQTTKHNLRVLDTALPAPTTEHVPIAARPVETREIEGAVPSTMSSEEYAAHVERLRTFTEKRDDS